MSSLTGLRVTILAGTLGHGGAERQLYWAASTLTRAGAEPRVLTLGREEFWTGPLRDLGVPVEWVGTRTSRAGRLAAIVGAVRRHRPDVLQSYHFYANLYVATAARLLRLPDLGAIRSSGTADLASVAGPLGQLCLRLPRLLVANSQAALTSLAALGVAPERLRLLPNVIDTAAFTPAYGRPDPRIFHVAAVGRLIPQKCFDRALRVCAALRPHLSRPLHVTVVGEGSARAELERLTTALGLADVVTFAGALGDVRPTLRDADCLLLTSDVEGTPNVILEAMAAGRPVVATAVGGTAAVVDDNRTGFLRAADDEAGLTAALKTLADDAALAERLGRAGRERVETDFGLPSLEASLCRLYEEVVPARARHRPAAPGDGGPR